MRGSYLATEMNMSEFAFISENLESTHALGRALGALAEPNLVVGLIGPLGAGKTAMVRGVAEGLGIDDSRRVTSPTFVLIHEYPARLPMFHFDTYRLSMDIDFADLGVAEYFEAGGVCLVEWADRFANTLPAERIEISLSPLDESRREIRCRSLAVRWNGVVHQLEVAARKIP